MTACSIDIEDGWCHVHRGYCDLSVYSGPDFAAERRTTAADWGMSDRRARTPGDRRHTRP